MKATLTVCVVVIMAAILALTWELDNRERRITQLEIALAQAHAEADTLEAMLERRGPPGNTKSWPDTIGGRVVREPCAPLGMMRESD